MSLILLGMGEEEENFQIAEKFKLRIKTLPFKKEKPIFFTFKQKTIKLKFKVIEND